MLSQQPIIVQPLIRSHHPTYEEYCTVVFRLQDGRSAMGCFLAELCKHFDGSSTVEIVKFEMGDHLRDWR
ncbi:MULTISPECIES: hypothetical protein [unclassified Pseudomonas]|uniref:hypothetical protein n=1 Tax=unclassified Pseudomonas TaxID=196821 RepID=UPI0006D3D5E7|nr:MULTISPECIES: hypothetical protein [unclassified Pseudomonas]MQT99356.1 hypothetical protein [Pseudomonas sp. FSL R10-2245]